MKFLIVKTSSLGDIIHAFKALAYLRYKCPYAQIDWVVEKPFRLLVERHPMIDRVHIIDTKAWRKQWWRRQKLKFPLYDIVFDLQGNLKSAWVLSKVKAKLKFGFGFKSVAEWPNCLFTNKHINPPKGQNIRDDYLAIIQAFFQEKHPFKEQPFLFQIEKDEEAILNTIVAKATLVCPSAAWKNKQLPNDQLINELKNISGPLYFIWGSELERQRVEELSQQFVDAKVLPKLSLPLLQRVMDRCQLVISMDSLPLHLCGTTTTPTISFFGPSSSQKYAPVGKQHQTFQGDCPFNQVFEKRCPKLRSCQSAACINKLKSR